MTHQQERPGTTEHNIHSAQQTHTFTDQWCSKGWGSEVWDPRQCDFR